MTEQKSRSNKRVITLLLAVVIVLGTFGISGFASAGIGKIDGFSGDVTLENTYELGQSGSVFYSGDDSSSHFNIEVKPGDEVRIPLTADMFTWSDQRSPLPFQAVTLRDLKEGKVMVRTESQKNSDVLDYIQLETDMFVGKPFYAPNSTAKTGRTSYISVMFAEEVVSVKDLDFRFVIYLTVDGKKTDDMKIVLEGTMVHEVQKANSSTDFVNLSDGSVLETEEFVKNVKIDAGNGITIDRMLLADKSYYATAEIKPASDPGFEKEFPEIYPSVVLAYKLNTVNMRHGRSEVKIDTTKIATDKDMSYYVYNENMELVGRSKEALPYSDYYFLSTEEIPTFEKDAYLESLTKKPSYSMNYESGELAEEAYLNAEETKEKASAPRKDANGVDMSSNIVLLPKE